MTPMKTGKARSKEQQMQMDGAWNEKMENTATLDLIQKKCKKDIWERYSKDESRKKQIIHLCRNKKRHKVRAHKFNYYSSVIK